MQEYKLKPSDIKSAEAVLSKGDRVELVPGPDGEVKVLHVRRKVVKSGPEKAPAFLQKSES